MHRNNPASASKLNTPIELTPLLDVIFIVLFIVIISNALNTKKATEQAESEANAVRQEMRALESRAAGQSEEIASLQTQLFEQEAARQLAEERLDEFEGSVIGRRVKIVTVSCVYDAADTTHRRLSAAAPDDSFPAADFRNDNAETTFARFANWLETYIRANTGLSADKAERVIIVLSVGTENILKRDREAIDRIIAGLEEKYDDVY